MVNFHFISSKTNRKTFPTDKLITNYQIQSTLLSNENFNNLTRTQSTQWKNAQSTFSFTSPQPIRPKEASDSDFTIENVMLWLGMRFSLRSQCKRCSAGRLHNFLPYGSRSSHSCSTRRNLRIEDRMLPARHGFEPGFEPTSSTITCPASPPFLFYFVSTH